MKTEELMNEYLLEQWRDRKTTFSREYHEFLRENEHKNTPHNRLVWLASKLDLTPDQVLALANFYKGKEKEDMTVFVKRGWAHEVAKGTWSLTKKGEETLFSVRSMQPGRGRTTKFPGAYLDAPERCYAQLLAKDIVQSPLGTTHAIVGPSEVFVGGVYITDRAAGLEHVVVVDEGQKYLTNPDQVDKDIVAFKVLDDKTGLPQGPLRCSSRKSLSKFIVCRVEV